MNHGLAVDSFGRHTSLSTAALVEGGVRCVLRYHYNTDRQEVATVHRAGLAFCLIAEFDTPSWHPPIHAPEMGAVHARTAIAKANALGMPAGCKITLTADTMIRPRDFDHAARYWELAAPIIRDAGYLVDAYGGSLFIDHLHEHGLTDMTWEAAARSWSSPTGGVHDYQPSQTATMRQLVQQPTYGGVTCDLNEFLREPQGEWMPDGTVTAASRIATPKEWRMRAIAVNGQDQQWRIVSDGFGRDRRSPITSQAHKAVLIGAGVLDGPLDNTHVLSDPAEVAAFEQMAPANDRTADVGSMVVGAEIVRLLSERIATIPGSSTPTVAADQIIDELAERLKA